MSDPMMNSSPRIVPPRIARPSLMATVVALAVIAVAIVWRFSPWTHPYFYGDDLDYLLSVRNGVCATQAADILTATCQDRFRPVASAFVIAGIEWFGAQMRYFSAVNFIIQFLIAVLAFACARRLGGGRILVATMVALAIGTSRFALFHATQAIGPVESLTFLAALACMYCVLRFDAGPPRVFPWALGALVSAFIAIHTHERFVVLAAWLLVALLSSPASRGLPWRKTAALAVACMALPASYIAYKTLVLDTTFMVGTSSTRISFDSARIIGFARDAISSIFGFNRGPDYLAGAPTDIGFNFATVLGTTFAASWFALLGLGGVHALRGRRAAGIVASLDAVRWPLLLLMLAFFALFPALLTIRLEHRWLLAPFACIVLVAAWAAGRPANRQRGLAIGLCCVLGLSSVAVDSMAMRQFDRIFLVSAARFAETAKRDIIDAEPDSRGPIRIVADIAHCQWTLRHGLFFRVYGKGLRPTTCYPSVEAAAQGTTGRETLYSVGSDGRLVKLSGAASPALPGRAAAEAVVYDFLSNFAAGTISDPRRVDTPTGRGTLVLPWDSTAGRDDAMIILSGFSHRFEAVRVPVGASLRFGVSMMFPAPQPARLVITATPAGSTANVLFSRDLAPPGAGAALDFQPTSIDLAGLGGQDVAFEFSVLSPGGDATAHWVGLAKPAISQREPSSVQLP